jgi:uncharacterized delta-60 repeat protein
MKNFILLPSYRVNYLINKISQLTLIALFCLLSNFMYAQPGTIDTSFNPTDTGFGNGDGSNYDVYSIVVQGDGKMIIGGLFTNYNGFVINRIARLNADGSLDTTFNIGLGAAGGISTTTINSIVLQGDGKVLIGGNFGTYDGIPISNIARLNTDGSLDTTFNPGYIDGSISSIAVQGDGKILIGGSFSTYNDITRYSIARLNADGSLDSAFNPGGNIGGGTSVGSIAIQSDSKILIGGSFTYYYYYYFFGSSKTSLYKNIARFNNDGSIDTTFNPSPIPPPSLHITGTDGGIASIVSLGNGKVIIGGDFTTYNGTARGRIAELNADGSLDTTFNTGSGADSGISSIALHGDGKVLIGGGFTNFNGSFCNRIARLNTDGSLDITFNTDNNLTPVIYFIALQGNGKVLIGGNFTMSNGVTMEKNIARLNVDGSSDTTFNPGTGADGSVSSIVVKANGKMLVGGGFINYNGSGRNSIVQLNADGSLDATFNPGNGANSAISSIALQADGKVLIGGGFTSYNGTVRNGIARLNIDGSLDITFNPGIGANGAITSIALQANGKVLIGGNFTNYNGTEINSIARLNVNGSLDTTFNPGTGFNAIPSSIVVQGDGKVLVGGSFTIYNGTARSGIARLNTNGSLDTTFNPGTGTSGNFCNVVSSIVLQADGKIIIGGCFTSYNGTLRKNLARLYTNGSLDTAYNPITIYDSIIYSLAIQGDDKVLIGVFIVGTSEALIARLNTNGSQDNLFNPGTGPESIITSMAVQADGKVLIGGLFTSYNGIGRNRIARINGDTALSSIGFENNVLKIYPNPSNGIFTLQTNEINATKSISIYTIIGQKIYDTAISSNETTIDISNQPKGVYLYKVFGEKGETKNGKLVIE